MKISKIFEDVLNGGIDLEVAAKLLLRYYDNMGYSSEERLSSSGKKSKMAKMNWAKKKLDDYLGFDIGHLPSHTPEQKETIKKIHNITNELRLKKIK